MRRVLRCWICRGLRGSVRASQIVVEPPCASVLSTAGGSERGGRPRTRPPWCVTRVEDRKPRSGQDTRLSYGPRCQTRARGISLLAHPARTASATETRARLGWGARGGGNGPGRRTTTPSHRRERRRFKPRAVTIQTASDASERRGC